MESAEVNSRWRYLTHFAFILLLALVAVRALTNEIIRDPVEVSPGMAIAPRIPGAGTNLMLDLAMCIPAMLVLLRRTFDRNYKLKFTWSYLPLALLAIWAAVSFRWSSDKFICVIEAAQLITAVVVAFAMMQLVRSWLHVRIVCGLMVGLLLAYLASAVYYKTVELPDVQENFAKHKLEIFKDRNWEPDSFAAKQFEKKVMSGDMVGFHASPNSFAAVVVLMFVVMLGLIADRLATGERKVAIALMLLIPAAVWLIAVARARTSGADAVMASILMLGLVPLRAFLRQHRKLVIAAIFAAAIGVTALIVSYGLKHNNLINDSLTFRWRYWVASARMFEKHPLVGVGYASFGDHYLAVREPAAAEEIRDPHDFVVRICTELGAIGGTLLLVWLILLVIEIISRGRKSARDDTGEAPSLITTKSLLFIAILVLAISLIATVDWSQPWYWKFLETVRRIMYFLLTLAGLLICCLKSSNNDEIEDRRSPWLLYGIIIALGTFAIANAMDFSVFEPGPMFLCFMLIGTVLGMKSLEVTRRTIAGPIALVASGVGWCAAFMFVALPIAVAEGYQHESEDALKAADFQTAVAEMSKAKDQVPYNYDYYLKAARMLSYGGAPEWSVGGMLQYAVDADPYAVQPYLLRARWQIRIPDDHQQFALNDYAKAIELNPNDLEIRKEYAAALEKFGKKAEARQQYQLVLKYNDLLDPTEPKRLTQQQIEEIKANIAELR